MPSSSTLRASQRFDAHPLLGAGDLVAVDDVGQPRLLLDQLLHRAADLRRAHALAGSAGCPPRRARLRPRRAPFRAPPSAYCGPASSARAASICRTRRCSRADGPGALGPLGLGGTLQLSARPRAPAHAPRPCAGPAAPRSPRRVAAEPRRQPVTLLGRARPRRPRSSSADRAARRAPRARRVVSRASPGLVEGCSDPLRLGVGGAHGRTELAELLCDRREGGVGLVQPVSAASARAAGSALRRRARATVRARRVPPPRPASAASSTAACTSSSAGAPPTAPSARAHRRGPPRASRRSARPGRPEHGGGVEVGRRRRRRPAAMGRGRASGGA